MDMSVESAGIKRIRQACANCRRKKTKCSGERPICFHCRRNRISCHYEPYSATIPTESNQSLSTTHNFHDSSNLELLNRISTIESRLAELSQQSAQQNSNTISSNSTHTDGLNLPSSGSPTLPTCIPGPIDYSSYPPLPVLHSVIDTYFDRCHNKPYSFFQEASFRERLMNDSLPRCLVLAVLSSAVRFSDHDYYTEKVQASSEYARESWLSVLTEHMAVEENLNLPVVQTVNLLAVVDYTAGRVSSGWLKIGLAARISQDLHLMMEPSDYLSYPEQEERRRTFWSAYLIDKLISCGHGRPIVIQDDDCYVQLPCDQHTLQSGTWKKTNTLSELLNWNSKVNESPSPFALVILMASIFGRCTRYVHRDKNSDDVPPWDTKSEFSAIKSALLLLESYSKIGDRRISEMINETHPSETGQLVFAHTLFHLCHCLLNHPFLVRLRLKPFAKAPSSFSAQALQAGADHARQLLDLLREASECGCRVESSFYAYCIAIAGSINSLASHFEHQNVARRQSDVLYYYQQSLDALNALGKFWAHSANMAVRLSEFHSIADQFSGLLDPARLGEDLDKYYEDILWSMIDYGILGSDPYKKPLIPRPRTSSLSSPDSWVPPSCFNVNASPRLSDNHGIFEDFSPAIRLNEVEHLLNCSPGTNGLV